MGFHEEPFEPPQNLDPYARQVIDSFGFVSQFEFALEDNNQNEEIILEANQKRLIHNLTNYTFDGSNPAPVLIV